ncbi:ATPase domain-containing protein [Thalassoglobus sp. JC818]|uniref:RAD55 family ATPase n=1 Tax=Thalassoglobus sp. JC818 TaxID=3232136 RepID=UPI003457B486
MTRQTTGIPDLDKMLGGGLLPGTLTVVLGATGIGKTQLGIQYAHAGKDQEGESGIIYDMTSRGDTQSHADYAERLFDWKLRERPAELTDVSVSEIWNPEVARWDALHLFQRAGRRVTMSDMDFDQKKEWKAELNRKLNETIAFFYGNFCQGVRRCVIDGIEPSDRASDSFQFDLFEYIYHQILRKESDWVARDYLRVAFRQHEQQVNDHAYDHSDVGCMMLCTTHETMLDDLLTRQIESGDVLSNANTIILMGKVREEGRIKRALHVAKHRGSACDDAIREFVVTESGLQLSQD